jgi:hypothetical protein
MTDALKFQVKISAVGEVRDADGTLLSSEPVEFVQEMTEDELRANGLTDEQITAIKEGVPS